uniref:DNA repair protein RadC n=1 Tax=Candidatus Kentrum sp. FW TaxID=2126338 RepID=A0A450RZ95_9GAMM|nr:MAG: DNA repair protein RadC [Candidatus Kentron sp. FW]VFJ54152.1 MAG: DNA repair protein RadC [Candidatus Kentron sp. FW]
MQRLLLQEDEDGRRKEHFWVVGLSVDSRILYIELISLGGISAAVIDPIEVYRLAIIEKSHCIMLAHNHPDSIDVQPSERDKALTNKLVRGGKLLNIYILDHLIISEHDYYSFCEDGLIEYEEDQRASWGSWMNLKNGIT